PRTRLPTGPSAASSCRRLPAPYRDLRPRAAAPEVTGDAPDQRQQAAETDQHAAVPDPRHERLPPQPELPALALGLATERGIELTVPARQQRHLAGLLRRGPEAARLRAGDPNLAALVARLEPRLERGPVRPCDRFDRRQGDP